MKFIERIDIYKITQVQYHGIRKVRNEYFNVFYVIYEQKNISSYSIAKQT